MFVDASALTAILADEGDAHELLARLSKANRRISSPLAIWETVLAVARILALDIGEAQRAVADFCRLVEIEIQAVPVDAGPIAIDAFARFGKGRHPAALNFGDCFAYACARTAGQSLLYKGEDFPLTDIETA